jgi:von Willebrand factor type A domain/Aerotolerance regulator N-terminal
MIFTGLGLLQMLALFGGASAFMVALYVLKLRRRTFAVPFAPLWDRILKDKEATQLFSKLKRLLSLLVQLLVLGLLTLALGDPRARETQASGRTLVVLVDASASMQAVDVVPSRLDSAKEQVATLIAGLGGKDRMLIAQMDATTTPLGPLSSDRFELEHALSAIHKTDARADFARALRFATDTLRGALSPEIVVVSDGNVGPASDASGTVHLGEIKLSFISVGQGNRNVGVTQFSVRRYPLDKSRYEVMLEVTNTGPEVEDVELSLLGDEQVVDITKLRLKAGERLPRFYPNLSGASRTLEARLRALGDSRDILPADDHAFALLPERQRVKVMVVTAGNTYLEAALLLDEYLDVSLVTPQQYAETFAGQINAYGVVLFDGVTPTEPPRAHAIYLDPRGPGAPVKVEAEIKSPGFDRIDRKHPLVRFLALDDVNIAKAHRLIPASGDKVVGASEQGALLVTGTRAGYRFVALGFDPRDSDLPLRIAWPLLLVNSINFFTDDDTSFISSLRTGDVWRIPVRGEVRAAELQGPFGLAVTVPVHESHAIYMGERAGFYELRSKALGEDAKAAFAANLLDVEESRVAPQKALVVDGKTAGGVLGFSVSLRRELWIYLLIAVVVVAVVEWATYHLRITV